MDIELVIYHKIIIKDNVEKFISVVYCDLFIKYY